MSKLGKEPWPKWHRPYLSCSDCRGAGCDRCECNHQNDYLQAHPEGAFAQYFAIAANPLTFVEAIYRDAAAVDELAGRAQLETANLTWVAPVIPREKEEA